MKTIKLILTIIIVGLTTQAFAQPQKARNAIFKLVTYKANGEKIATTEGVFISKDGIALGAWNPFKGAAKAEISDSKGKTYTVSCIYGANELYNVAKFKVANINDATPISLATTPAKPQTPVWVMSQTPQKTVVSSTETFLNKYTYTILEGLTNKDISTNPDNYNGSAVVNEKGELIGLYNFSSSAQSATDARYADAFQTNALSFNDVTLRQTYIRIAIPSELKDAQVYLMFAQDKGGDYYQDCAQDFIHQFPAKNDGYYALAMALTSKAKYAEANAIMQKSIQNSKDKAEAHYNFSRLIQNYLNYIEPTDTNPNSFKEWNWEKAMEETDNAIKLNSSPLYQQQRGEILYRQKKYQEAYDQFIALTKQPQHSGELFYKAFLAKNYLNASQNELISLLDSAIAISDTVIAAPYFYARALLYEQEGKYREALKDYIVYGNVNFSQLNGNFYFQRYQCERKGKFYQLALQDIAHAVFLDINNADYWAELASLNLQLKKLDEAEKAADGCLKADHNHPEGLLIKGIIQCENHQKEEGLKNIQQAKELGNTQAESFLEKYK